jgi:hypothetical protein
MNLRVIPTSVHAAIARMAVLEAAESQALSETGGATAGTAQVSVDAGDCCS